jgi:hypothetical protein
MNTELKDYFSYLKIEPKILENSIDIKNNLGIDIDSDEKIDKDQIIKCVIIGGNVKVTELNNIIMKSCIPTDKLINIYQFFIVYDQPLFEKLNKKFY